MNNSQKIIELENKYKAQFGQEIRYTIFDVMNEEERIKFLEKCLVENTPYEPTDYAPPKTLFGKKFVNFY